MNVLPRKGLIIFGIFVLLLLTILILLSASKKETQVNPSYFGLQSYPGADLIEENMTPDENSLTRVVLSAKASVPQIAQWYMDNISSSEWQLDIPSGDMSDENVQYLRLMKEEVYLGISIIAKDSDTQIVLEQFPKPNFDAGSEKNETKDDFEVD